MGLDSLEGLFLEELKDVYNAEKQITKALPRMAKAADSEELQQALTKHLKETEGQIKRLERIFQTLGQTARGKKCKGMEGLIEEGKEVLEEDGDPAVIDAAIIASRSPPTAASGPMPACWGTARRRSCWTRPSPRRKRPTRS